MASTNFDPKYARYNYLGEYDITLPYDKIFRPGTAERVVDELDQRIVEMMYTFKASTPYMFNSDEQFTTVVYNHYGTTTPWWIVLMYNGLETPLQIQPGMVLNFPLKSEMDAFIMNLLVPDRRGQIVAI